MKIDILTIFPKMFEAVLNESILARAQKEGYLKINIRDLRTWTSDPHRTVDDRPFGGGPGMILKVEPIAKALAELKEKDSKVIVMSAKGKCFDQAYALALSKTRHLIVIAPHYEGIDERVIEHFADEELSIGPYVLTGGELPALVIIDATARLIPGVVGKEESVEMESYACVKINGEKRSILEYPQYTRPEVYQSEDGKEYSVPKILLSGDHEKIVQWRLANTRLVNLSREKS